MAGVFDNTMWPSMIQLIVLICLLPATLWLYNLLLHPLARFPGPLLWRASRIPFLRAAWDGHFPYVVKKLHDQYGDVVRIAPNELSFTSSDAWDDIYTNRNRANRAFVKSELWYGSSGDKASSVHFITNLEEHSRVRRFIGPAFSEKAVLQQEPIVQEHVALLINKLSERLPDSGSKTVNIVDWLHFALFDIIGDLAFGEPFGCLQRCEYEPWMSQTNSSVRFLYFTIQLRHYPRVVQTILGRMLGLSIPPELLQHRKSFRQRTAEKLDRRLSAESGNDRQDIVAQLLKSEDRKEGLTREEVMLNCIVFIHAASETTVTTLTGALNHLLHNPPSLFELQREIRAFTTSSELTFQTLKQLPYLDAVLREALRMCNPNPIGHMRVSPPAGGEVAGHFVPGNTLITIQPVALSYSDQHFHKAGVWHPERWLHQAKTDPKSPFYGDDRKSIRAFGAGPYNCIGEPLGWAEMRLILAKLMWTFDLAKADTGNASIAWEEQQVYATIVKHPLDISVSRRRP